MRPRAMLIRSKMARSRCRNEYPFSAGQHGMQERYGIRNRAATDSI